MSGTPRYLTEKDQPGYGQICLCGCGEFTGGWLYRKNHAPGPRLRRSSERSRRAHPAGGAK